MTAVHKLRPKYSGFFFTPNCFTSIVWGIEWFLIILDEYLNKYLTSINRLQILIIKIFIWKNKVLVKCGAVIRQNIVTALEAQ